MVRRFALVFLFSDQPAIVDRLRQRLADIYRARVTGLKIPLPEPPDLLSAQRTDWQEASLQFLARLNEQREPLRHTLSRPLILVLPLADKARIKELAPDLWAIRHFSLKTGPWLAPAAAPVPNRPSARPESFPLNDTEQALIQEWRRLQGKDSTDRGALLASLAYAPAIPYCIADSSTRPRRLPLGWKQLPARGSSIGPKTSRPCTTSPFPSIMRAMPTRHSASGSRPVPPSPGPSRSAAVSFKLSARPLRPCATSPFPSKRWAELTKHSANGSQLAPPSRRAWKSKTYRVDSSTG